MGTVGQLSRPDVGQLNGAGHTLIGSGRTISGRHWRPSDWRWAGSCLLATLKLHWPVAVPSAGGQLHAVLRPEVALERPLATYGVALSPDAHG